MHKNLIIGKNSNLQLPLAATSLWLKYGLLSMISYISILLYMLIKANNSNNRLILFLH